ncbi:hypothetical protein [Methyloferula stellata]|uniref:hypothetical protein n=1 Tax=Methyloferula stellata TaxID=876270 RepID=UPI0003637887|nr:hypothetical protein [Methyloferula stellata]
MIADRYLLGRAGRTHLSIRTQAIKRVWRMDAAAPAYPAEPIDLRLLLGGTDEEPGVAIAFETGETIAVLIIDAVGGMATIPETEFFALPQVFGFARDLFDAACCREVEGTHPLRLRRQLNLS